MSDETTLKEKNEQAARMAQLVLDNSQSIDRMSIMAALLNVFNLAILKQAGRPQWNPADAYLFTQALTAVDQIGELDVAHQQPQTRNAVSRQEDPKDAENIEGELAKLTGKLNGSRGHRDDERLPQITHN